MTAQHALTLTPSTCCFLVTQGTGQLWVYYWMGLSFNNVTNQWIWTDGDSAGNGAVSNANPCERQCLCMRVVVWPM
jgi:hypothetical protein